MKNNFIFLFIIIIIFTNNCDHGLTPPEPEKEITGISGTIFYQNWPPVDSIYDLRLVIFKNYPPGDIFSEVMNGKAVVHPAIGESHLPYQVDTTSYFTELAAGNYQYIVVAQQVQADLYARESWRVVGQYDTTLTDTLPTPILVIQDSILAKINIIVDFDHLPVQPF